MNNYLVFFFLEGPFCEFGDEFLLLLAELLVQLLVSLMLSVFKIVTFLRVVNDEQFESLLEVEIGLSVICPLLVVFLLLFALLFTELLLLWHNFSRFVHEVEFDSFKLSTSLGFKGAKSLRIVDADDEEEKGDSRDE